MTDTALLGRVGTAELAALGLVDAVLDAAIVPAVGLVEAMQITVARRSGEARGGAVGTTFVRAFALVAAVSFVAALALRLAAGPVAAWAVGSSDVASAVEDFFAWGSWGILFLALNLAYGSLWVGLGRARILVGATALLVVANLVLSYGLIFGALGFPRLGMEGAGIGFLGAEILTFLLLTAQTVRRFRAARPAVSEEPPASTVRAASLVRLGAPISLQALVEALRWVAFFLVVEQLGEEALAWSSLVYACYALLLIPSQAFAEAGYAMVSRVIGEGRGDRVPALLRAITLRTLAATLPLLAVALVLPGLVLSVFTGDSGAASGAEGALQVLALGMVVVVAAEAWLAGVFGTGDTDAGFLIELALTTTVVGLAAVSALVLGLGVAFVWLSVPVGAAIGLGLSYARIRSGRWRARAV